MSKTDNNIRYAVLATDIVCLRIIDGNLSVLIGKVISSNQYKGMWALIGGLILPTETAEIAAERLLKDKAGIRKIYKEQLYTFSEIDRDPRGRIVSVAYLALAADDPRKITNTQIKTRWCTIDELPILGYDHNRILTTAIDRLRSKIIYTSIAKYLLQKEFTLTELQTIYEIVLKQKFDKRNFRKKILSEGILINTNKTKKQGIMRPAVLYSFIK